MAPNMAHPRMNDSRTPMLNVASEQPHRQDRLGGALLPDDEGDQQRRRCCEEADDRAGAPRVLVAAPHEGEQEGGDAGHEQHGARVVDAVLTSSEGQTQHRGRDDERDDADGDVDVEDPPPAEVVDEEAAEQGPGDRRDGEHCAEVARIAPSFPRGDDVADDGEGHRHQPTGADALEAAEGDELPHVLRNPAEHRPGDEYEDGRLEHDLAAIEVRQLSVQGCADGRGQQVGGDDPREVVEPTELADDGR
jgi:hypothetical protein